MEIALPTLSEQYNAPTTKMYRNPTQPITLLDFKIFLGAALDFGTRVPNRIHSVNSTLQYCKYTGRIVTAYNIAGFENIFSMGIALNSCSDQPGLVSHWGPRFHPTYRCAFSSLAVYLLLVSHPQSFTKKSQEVNNGHDSTRPTPSEGSFLSGVVGDTEKHIVTNSEVRLRNSCSFFVALTVYMASRVDLQSIVFVHCEQIGVEDFDCSQLFRLSFIQGKRGEWVELRSQNAHHTKIRIDTSHYLKR